MPRTTDPAPSDLLRIDDELADTERLVRDTVRAFAADRILPNVADWFEAGTLPKELFPEIGKLGLSSADESKFDRLLGLPHGIVVVTGPTGSGKTTTLATMLTVLNDTTRKILTIEDPIEYEIRGINQAQVKPSIGLTFATALRAFVRQDPDVIMVGEIRDPETAHIAIHAALTGHLVLTTLHTETAAAAVPRLLDLGVEGFLLQSTLRAVIAQRLVRVLCGPGGSARSGQHRLHPHQQRDLVADR